jgi:hypothetical protein
MKNHKLASTPGIAVQRHNEAVELPFFNFDHMNEIKMVKKMNSSMESTFNYPSNTKKIIYIYIYIYLFYLFYFSSPLFFFCTKTKLLAENTSRIIKSSQLLS